MQGSRHFALATAVAIFLVVAAPGTAPASAATPKATSIPHVAATTAHVQREVFGFALASSLANPSFGYPSWNFDLLSTVAFFGLHVGGTGYFAGDSAWSTWNSSSLTGLVSVAHQHGTKVVLTVVLQDFSPNTPDMCAGLQHADNTVAETVNQVKAKGLDGVNIDYEGLDGSCGTNDPYWAQHAFTTFAAKMRAGLGSAYYLSVDTYASSAADGYGFFDVPNLASYVDSFFVMAYDLEYSNYSRFPTSCSRFCLGPTAPLSGYYYNDASVASQYASAVGAGKVILGVPYYGRKACVGGAVPNGYPTSDVSADSYLDALTESTDPAVGAGSYTTHRDANSSGGERWDTWYNTSLGCTRELYWDDAVSLGKKYDLVNANRLRGVGIWNLNYGGGAPELWKALAGHFSSCASVSVAPSPASPQVAGTTVTFTASSTGCAQPLYQFWVRPPGTQAWQIVQAYSSSSTFRWNTASLAAGTYLYTAWARDASSGGTQCSSLGCNDAFFAAASFTVVRPCTSVTDSVSPTSPQLSGTPVTFSASAAGCPHPLYQFWTLAPGSQTWQVVQQYSSSATFTWKTAALPTGTYLYTVWARDASSTGTVCSYLGCNDAYYPGTQFGLTTPCKSVTDAATPSSPQLAGAAVTFSASAAGCPHPLYQFWVLTPGSSTWQIVQPYSTSSTFTWKTSGLAPGTYLYTVWARDAASTGTACSYLGCNDAYFPGTAYLVDKPCASVTDSVTPGGPQLSGTKVTFAASASGCLHPLYQFWILPPGSTAWQIVQPYSTSSTYTWSTSGLTPGTYLYTVWARDSASSGTACSYLGCNDAYYPGTGYAIDRPCTTVTDAVTPTSPQHAGASVTFTATSGGCLHPLYQFWILAPGSHTWQIVQAYSPKASFTWSTGGLAPGTYLYTVWVRDASSTGTACSYLGCDDAFFPGTPYTLT